MELETFKVVNPVKDLPVKVECFDVHGDLIFVGTQQGLLSVYRLTEDREASTMVVFFKNFSKRPITQVQAIPGLEFLVTLSDGNIKVHEIQINKEGTLTLQYVSQFHSIRSCSIFTTGKLKESGQHFVVAASKRQLSLFFYKEAENAFREHSSGPLQAAPYDMQWYQDYVYIGFRKEYRLFYLESGQTVSVCDTGRSRVPVGCPLPNEEVLILKDDLGYFFDTHVTQADVAGGLSPKRTYPLKWRFGVPQHLAYCFPYFAAVSARTTDIRSGLGAMQPLQRIDMPGGKCMSRQLEVTYPASQSPSGEAITRTVWVLFVGGPNGISLLLPQMLDTQIHAMVEKGLYEEAVAACDLLVEDRETVDRFANGRLACHQFTLEKYDLAMNHFRLSKCDPRCVLRLYPDLIPTAIGTQYAVAANHPLSIHKPEGENLKAALSALLVYLMQARAEWGGADGQLTLEEMDLAEMVDTALLRAYVEVNPAAVEAFLQTPHHVSIDVGEKVLSERSKYRELILLYKFRDAHVKALPLLKELVLGKEDEEASDFDTLGEMVSYLQYLGGGPYKDLAKDYIRFVLERNAEVGLKMFQGQQPKGTPPIPAQEVLEILKEHAPQLRIPYLEFIILERDEQGEVFHNQLAMLYKDACLELCNSDEAYVAAVEGGPEPSAEETEGELGVYRRRLVGFLSGSEHYSAKKLLFLGQFPDDCLFDARTILLRKCNLHEEALGIYAYRLGKPVEAEAYCGSVYNPDQEEAKDVYLSLLVVFLQPPPGFQPMEEAAIDLLTAHYREMDIKKALALLKPDVPLYRLRQDADDYFPFQFFTATMKHLEQTYRTAEIELNLLKMEHLRARESAIKARARHIKITGNSVCEVCHKRIADSVFRLYPNGIAVHYICSADDRVCPATGETFGNTS